MEIFYAVLSLVAVQTYKNACFCTSKGMMISIVSGGRERLEVAAAPLVQGDLAGATALQGGGLTAAARSGCVFLDLLREQAFTCPAVLDAAQDLLDGGVRRG